MNNASRLLLLFLLVLTGCPPTPSPPFPKTQPYTLGETQYSFQLSQASDTLYILKTTTAPAATFIRDFRIPYPVYQFQIGDVNSDQKVDCLIGVIKPTPFDSIRRKRLFIYTLQGNHFRKLWEGSRLVHPLQDFRLRETPDGPKVLTQESEKNGLSLVATYRYGSFGLEFLNYLARDLDSSAAAQLLSP